MTAYIKKTTVVEVLETTVVFIYYPSILCRSSSMYRACSDQDL